MPFLETDDARIHYETWGEGFPVLLLAPGGLRSSIPFWENAPCNPIDLLSPHCRVIAMDQRNAGQSTAPIAGTDGWHSFTGDQLALLDHLQVDRFHVVGMCIGGSFIMGLAGAVPDRIASAVMMQPIGFDDNRQTFHDMFDGWADEMRPAHPNMTAAEWAQFRSTLFDGDFLFNVPESAVAECATPMLVLMGTDVYHPEATSRRIAEIAPDARLIEDWKTAEAQPAAKDAIRSLLAGHS